MSKKLINFVDISKSYGNNLVLDELNLYIRENEFITLLGPSGCGKTTLIRMLMGLEEATGGYVQFGDKKIHRHMPPLVRKNIQMVFQDPYASLDPRMSIQRILEEPLRIHERMSAEEKKSRILPLLEQVGLSRDSLKKYPHEFSGGQRQRISIARALSVQPEFVVCDEPISALDVSLQAQIVQMLQDLQEKYGLTYLFISHQLQVVQKICDEIGVLYLGNLMEIADADKLYSNPLHPYTKMLISSIPVPDPRVKTLDQIVTDNGVQSRSIGGCRFHNRCPWCEERCRQEVPLLREAEPGHLVACHKY